MEFKKNYFVHPTAIVETDDIGEGTRIWEFTHLMKDVKIGKRCNIGGGCFIESGVIIGDDVVIKNNIAIWKGVKIEDKVFLGPNVVLTNEIEPRATFPKELATTLIKKGASLGANVTVVANRVINEYATIGAGSVVTKDIPAHRLVYGNPSRVHGWMCVCGRKLKIVRSKARCICSRKFIITKTELKQIT